MTATGARKYSRLSAPPVTVPEGPLRALILIETVEEQEPFAIRPVSEPTGSASTPAEAMAARVKWANRARYTILTRDVPPQFAPYNAIIRVLGTEDRRVDYLATLMD